MFVIGGPNMLGNPNTSPGVWESLLVSIREYASSKGLLFIQFEPVDSLEGSGFEKLPLLNPRKARYFLEPVTRLVDLRVPDEEILAQMKQKGRYNIRLAEKSGCDVKRVEPTREHLEQFMDILAETLLRDGFSGNTKAYYQTLLRSRTHPSEGLYFAYHGKTLVAAAIMIIQGSTAIYYYGASTSDSELRKHMPAYLIQWRMIQAAKSAGCLTYDFLGIAPENEPEHHLSGVTDFKAKFGGKIHIWPPKRQQVIKPVFA